MFNITVRVLTCAGLLLSAALSPVNAQTTDASTASGTGLEEVVVTAQRRAERLQDVPVTVSALTASMAEAAGVVNTQSLIVAVPGLDYSTSGPNGAAPYLRGVGNPSSVGGTESAVALFIDDVYIYAPAGNLEMLDNIERIEVLKGPQGTLFGRNATAGVIQVFTRDPTAKPTLETKVGYGNYQTAEGSLYGSTALSDTVAVNLSVRGSNQNQGWGRDLTNGNDAFLGWDWSTRAKLRWEPSSNTTVRFAADFARRETDKGVDFAHPPGIVGILGAGNPGRYNTFADPTDETITKAYGASVRLDQELGWAKLVSISAYRSTEQNLRLDQEGSPVRFIEIEIKQPSENFSQELQLQSEASSKLRWILGLYYLNGTAKYDPLATFGSAFPGNVGTATFSKQTIESYSGFAQGTYEIVDRTDLTLGLRYTEDRFGISGHTATDYSAPPQSATFSKPTYRISLDHRFTNDVLAYVSQSRGFKSGGYNILRYERPSVKPETLDATEIGIKTEWFDRRLRFNAAAFYYDYKNLQVQQIAVGAAYSINAGGAQIKGIDVDIAAVPLPNLTLTAGLSVLSGEYTSFPQGSINTPDPGVGNIQTQADLKGKDTVRTPPYSGSLGASYDINSSVGTWKLSANVYYNDGFYWEADNRLRQDSYTLVNASVGWTAASEKLGVRLWSNNLFNAFYYAYAAENVFGDQTSPAPPRTYGLTISSKF